MLMNLVGYFVLGVPIAALFGFALGYGAVGIWWGLVAGLVGAATLLTYRVKTQLAGEIARVRI
jgi:MATE family multidrug resistance protein